MIDAPVEAVWKVLRDFNGHDRWHPAVASSRLEDDRLTDQVGAVRSFVLAGGERLREQLIALDDAARTLRYAIVESEVPLIDYVADVELKPVTDGARTFWRWRSRFRTPPGREAELAGLVAAGVYEAGFEAIRERVEARAAPNASHDAAAANVAVAAGATMSAGAADEARDGPVGETFAGTAARIARHGGPEVIELVPCEAPPPGRGEVRLAQAFAGVNFIDVYCRTGRFSFVPPGGVLGMEATGTVIDVGPGVAGLAPGARVGYAAPPPGAIATVRTVPAEIVVALPDALGSDLAAAVLLKGITASFLVHRVHPVAPGETVLLWAPAGGVGQLLGPWCAALGARVIGVTSMPEKAEIARTRGCDEVVLRSEASNALAVAARVRELTGGRGVDVAFDAVGRSSWAASIASLSTHGHLVSFGQASGDLGARDVGALAGRSLRLTRPNYADFVAPREALETETRRLFDALGDGTLEAPEPAVYPLDAVPEAHRALESGTTTGPAILDLTVPVRS